MSSTSFNIGFAESKNSSRVLKPPGGGHTDIFGLRGDNDVQQSVKRKNHPQTTINSCFIHEEVTKPKNTDSDDNELKHNEDIENGNQNGVVVDVVDENTEPAKDNEEKSEEEEKLENKTNATPRRVRVPPGGFSSALW